MAYKEGHFRQSESVLRYGYFDTDNVVELDTFGELETQLNVFESAFLTEVRKIAGAQVSHIPILVSVPQRPIKETHPEEIKLSIAELAGMAAGIKLLRAREVMFFNRPSGFVTPSSLWAFEYFSNQQIKKVFPSWQTNPFSVFVSYISSRELFGRYNIVVSSNVSESRIRLGQTTYSLGNESTIRTGQPEISRKDLHSLIGFLRVIYLHSVLKNSTTPYVNLVNFPLKPFSDLEETQSFETLIKVDKIKAFI